MPLESFFIGFATAFFTIFAVHILFFRPQRTRFQTVVGGIMAVWALWSLKDLVLTFPGMYTPGALRWVMMVDGWSALTYAVFVFETTMTGWFTHRRFLLLSAPFAAFTLAYALWPTEAVTQAYAVFLWFFAWTVVIVGYVKVRQQIRYVRENFSNIEQIDSSWLTPVMIFSIVSQLAWLFVSFYANTRADIVYYVSVILLWLMVLRYSWNFTPIRVPDAEAVPVAAPKEYTFAGRLEQTMDEQQLYLNDSLTLSDLARAIGTNRTYASAYLQQVKGLTFYDYVNQLRIERKSIPLMREHPEYTLEHVARESGFRSLSTFRRAFVKLTGTTPSQFGRH